jgi:hypothetical protein
MVAMASHSGLKRIVEHTASRNDLLMMTQLGLAPTPQPAT